MVLACLMMLSLVPTMAEGDASLQYILDKGTFIWVSTLPSHLWVLWTITANM